MSKASWNTVNPASGTGDATISVGGSIHTGRNDRESTITFKADGVDDQILGVTQQGKQLFVTMNDISVPKDGGKITITGKSNSSKLTFETGNGDLAVIMPSPIVYTAGGIETSGNNAIAGDPGASAEYDFSMVVTVYPNEITAIKTKEIRVGTNGSAFVIGIVSQAAGDPILSLGSSSVTIPSDGDPGTVPLSSNTEWAAE